MSPAADCSNRLRTNKVVRATWFGGLLCGIALALTACDKQQETPDWDRPGAAPQVEAPAPAAVSAPAPDETPAPKPPRSISSDGLRFITYNVENWLVMDRYVDNRLVRSAPKPVAEKVATVKLLARHRPDLIGLCEIGEAGDLAEIQQRLKAAGIDLPHSHYMGGTDAVRHLGLLSKFPITSTAKPAETEFRLQGRTFGINRGILDATIRAHGKSYRLLGVHLKSKRAVEEADQEQMRIHEARLLRRHVDSILRQDPDARLIVYGDFNDTRATRTIKTVTGSYNDPGYLTAIPFKDARGHAWTHHWAPHDIYSRIDFVMVTRALRPEVDFQGSYIVDDDEWSLASDHRPLVAIFR